MFITVRDSQQGVVLGGWVLGANKSSQKKTFVLQDVVQDLRLAFVNMVMNLLVP
jgi:hypothetical protein